MEINKTNLIQFRADFANAVKALEQQYNVKINLGNIKYSTLEFTSKIEVKNMDKQATEAKEFITTQAFASLGHPELHYGLIITSGGKSYKIIGCNSSKPKNCVELQCLETGKGASCSLAFASLLSKR